ncbi:uncharacterized protein MELLADRAFT_64775 [Melampsora larici-populina 98AG31]|uniref:Uncharacterized protein n=1 Tax=Melampsora larici-populina (strain 98AG31 / pathotype 3-4-7) TaxID=747676 RepID=F4RSR3_MELLP|nr:uncharacterized protein MELLADRAFT_64775 [Melampsora larici-populina 98AG31]EGG04647.1 hypothetical protein MELLADRAFT_64775 [Melampsora larici-populina 98AG31]
MNHNTSSNRDISAIGVTNNDDNEIKIEISTSARLSNQHTNLRQRIHVNPAHRNMENRTNPTAMHLMAGSQAQANSIYQVRDARRASFLQAAAEGEDNYCQAHRGPHLGERTGNFSSALADPRQCGAQAQPKYHPDCGLLQVGSGSITNDTPLWNLDDVYDAPRMNNSPNPFQLPNQIQPIPANPVSHDRIIPAQTTNALPIKMVTLQVFHEAYLWGPKEKSRGSTSKAIGRRGARENLGCNFDKTDKKEMGPNHQITFDLNRVSPEDVINKMVAALDKVQHNLGTYLINILAPQSVTWFGVSLTPQSHFRNQKYNLFEIDEWNAFKALSDHLHKPSSAGLLVQMTDPDAQVATQRKKEIVGNCLGSWNTGKAIANSQPSNLASTSTLSQNLPSKITADLKDSLSKEGTDQARFKDPIDNKKWVVITPLKSRIWVDEIVLARREGRTDVDLHKPPPTPAFKTFLNGKPPPGYVEFPNNPLPVGFMASTQVPLVQIPSINPAPAQDDRIYQREYLGDINAFLNYAEIPETDVGIRTSLSSAHYTRWSDLKPSVDMNSTELKQIGIAPGDAGHLLASAVRYEGFLMAKLCALDAQKL